MNHVLQNSCQVNVIVLFNDCKRFEQLSKECSVIKALTLRNTSEAINKVVDNFFHVFEHPRVKQNLFFKPGIPRSHVHVAEYDDWQYALGAGDCLVYAEAVAQVNFAAFGVLGARRVHKDNHFINLLAKLPQVNTDRLHKASL